MPEFESEPVPVDFASAFDDWIAGASVSARSVTVYAKQGIRAEYDKLEAELAIAQRVADEDKSLGDQGVASIHERMEALYNEMLASKST